MSAEARDLLWPIHVTYVTTTGKTGQFVFSDRQFELDIELEEDEAVWFNSEMKGFYLPMPDGPYLQNKIIPKLEEFSDSDQFGILYLMEKMINFLM